MKPTRHLRRWMALLLSLAILLAPAALAADDLDRMIEQGAALLAEGDRGSASMCYEIAGKLAKPDDLKRMVKKGENYLANGNYEPAVMCYQIAVRLAPGDAAALKGYAQALMALSRHAEALTQVNRALEAAPADPSLYLMRCEIDLVRDDTGGAAKDIRYAELCGGEISPELYARMGMAFSQDGDHAAALDAFERAGDVALSEEFAETYGRTLIRTGNRDKAESLNLVQSRQRDERLAAALASGATFRLERETLDVLDCPVFCSAYYADQLEEEGYQGTLTEDGKRIRVFDRLEDFPEDLDPEVIEPRALSPDGETCLLSIGAGLYIHRNGELTLVAPNPDRGPEDQGKEQLDKLQGELGRMLEQDSVAWSPDGRYAALTFANRALNSGRFLDLMLLDLESGDLFLCESTPSKIREEGTVAALYALFDEDGKSLYYVVYGNVGDDGRAALRRYDLKTGTAETLIVSPDFLGWPGLFMDGSGALRCLIYDPRRSDPDGIMYFIPEGDRWDANAKYFDISNASMGSFQRMQYSSNSGLTLLNNNGTTRGFPMNTIQVLDDEDWESTQDRAVMLPVEGEVAERVDDRGLAEGVAHTRNADGGMEFDRLPWKHVVNSAVSPDGYCALLATYTYGKGEYVLRLLDMKTLALADVQLPEGITFDARRSQNAFQWIDENRVLLGTREGNILFTLTWEE